jgi:hypothetical protein
MNWKGLGMKRLWSTPPAFVWRDYGKRRYMSVRITSLRAEIRTRDLHKANGNVEHSAATFKTRHLLELNILIGTFVIRLY